MALWQPRKLSVGIRTEFGTDTSRGGQIYAKNWFPILTENGSQHPNIDKDHHTHPKNTHAKFGNDILRDGQTNGQIISQNV